MSTAAANIQNVASARDREIVSADVIVTCPARNFVTLKIDTRSGIFGLGDATLNGRELAVAVVPEGSPGAESHRPRRRPHRRHVAVFLSRRVLASRAR